ncbi:hypothetical protein CH251_05340 [Rhodococcus sp. 06-462-5]|uniref:aromatic-ring-hydroxylating dioxygenase subunit beta n=1 Tax=unclassified Rhodococcus (in: high G+C Gram-positive bacteria) TaxID=192944 RepID=UPI000B9AC34E|nr:MULTISPECIES: aromatic-ring-hydroxylating dioxygenase subunit beta [unclassified Rhodococcus (in: high G+C Gram-positive bacteria)]OZC77217.1 hypothetical protein CH251_05340 [Rhodococcus sp. 06-462-5]OZE63374.1 hypothetical protein CH270_17920 [Rhodococcus sp. 02-925g]
MNQSSPNSLLNVDGDSPPPAIGFHVDERTLLLLSTFRAFLDHESRILDDSRRLWEWFALLTPDITYSVPVRLSRERRSRFGEFSPKARHMQEDHASLRMRIERLDTEHAWAEEPPSRLRRVVSGVEILNQTGSGEYEVASSFLLFRGRDRLEPDLLAGQRHDRLRFDGKNVLLARRTIYLEHTVLPTANLGIFL